MMPDFFKPLRAWAVLIALLLVPGFAAASPQHGIAMYGAPALPQDFVALPYVNPDAPKGGRIVLGEAGGYDSLNPFILKGSAPWGLRLHAYESLMGRSWDEPFTLYGLLAESVETGPDRDWVEFTLREEARFWDGSPVTVQDVLWSFEILGTQGHPRYRNAWAKIATAKATGPRSVRFTFNTPDRELPLILGLRPVLKKAQWDGRAFDESGMEAPIGTGPYVIAEAVPGRLLSLRRDPDYWGWHLPLNRGQHNFNEIRYEYFGDGDVVFEAFRGGAIDVYREGNAAKWETTYDFPAVRDGQIVKAEIPHQRPSGISGLVMNTRRPIFADWRVRDAMLHAFNFEFINATLNGASQPRIASYFSNSVLGMRPGPAEGRVRDLLAPFADSLLPGALEGYALPSSDGRSSNRRNLRRAFAQLQAAGWTVADDGVLRDAQGTPFTFEILLRQGATETQQIVDIFAEHLKRLGIGVRITAVDSAQYTERTDAYDFDMTFYSRALSLSPGNEQRLYWGREGVSTPGTRNWMGMDSPAAEAMIDAMLTADSHEDFVAATRALDRVLTTGRYVIPIWYAPASRLAHRAWLRYPDTIPAYGDWMGFLPDIWWSEKE
ncbi:extracellular solute-binding protein [Rhodovulum adriaticum]|uniref:Peptide/nickel transport system substrate-binding protein n=1 Tax=Rhodovulum adriaticum TaxID=35804 RepID=A0A4R2NN06_RHOAD|nr:extracellular solute-binding protein [Rhodovulum adriaticum]MBK1634537.1 ABC transporter substrate-binding protein [Rhodovulum adriaticum]TCP23093.1 peptide/nickel transport system substrate-binding protein [Rhodovulum adriaticum]